MSAPGERRLVPRNVPSFSASRKLAVIHTLGLGEVITTKARRTGTGSLYGFASVANCAASHWFLTTPLRSSHVHRLGVAHDSLPSIKAGSGNVPRRMARPPLLRTESLLALLAPARTVRRA